MDYISRVTEDTGDQLRQRMYGFKLYYETFGWQYFSAYLVHVGDMWLKK